MILKETNMNVIKIRVNKKLVAKKDGLDFAVWQIFTNVNKINLLNIKDDRVKNSQVRIYLHGSKTESQLLKLSKEYGLSKSEISRRCLKWLENQTSYYKKYPNNK